MKKRFLSALLALSMFFSIMPVGLAEVNTYDPINGFSTSSPINYLKINYDKNGNITNVLVTPQNSGHGAAADMHVVIAYNWKVYADTDMSGVPYELVDDTIKMTDDKLATDVNTINAGDGADFVFPTYRIKKTSVSNSATKVDLVAGGTKEEPFSPAFSETAAIDSVQAAYYNGLGDFYTTEDGTEAVTFPSEIPVKIYVVSGATNGTIKNRFEYESTIKVGTADYIEVPAKSGPTETYVDDITVSVTDPALKVKPGDNTTAECEDPNVDSASVAWDTTPGVTTTNGYYKADTAYTGTVTVNAIGSAKFKAGKKIKINDAAEVTLTSDMLSNNDQTAKVTYTAPKTPKLKVEDVTVGGSLAKSAYEAGENLSVSAMTATLNYNDGEESDAIDLTKSNSYGVAAVLAADASGVSSGKKHGNALAVGDDGQIFVVYDSENDTASGTVAAAKYTKASGQFVDVTAPDQKISNVNVKIAFPVIGANINQTASTDDTGYTIEGDVTWQTDSTILTSANTFEYGKAYTATVLLNKSTGYAWDTSVTAKFIDTGDQGNVTATWNSDDNYVTYEFPAVVAPTVSKVNDYDYYNGGNDVELSYDKGTVTGVKITANGKDFTLASEDYDLTTAKKIKINKAKLNSIAKDTNVNLGSTAQTWTAKVSFTGMSGTADADFSAVDTTPYATINTPTGGTSATIKAEQNGTNVSFTAGTPVALTKDTEYTLTVENLPAHLDAITWDVKNGETVTGKSSGTKGEIYTFTTSATGGDRIVANVAVTSETAKNMTVTVNNGTIKSVKDSGGNTITATAGKYPVYSTETYTIEVQANQGYKFDQWTNATQDGTVATKATVANPVTDVNVTADFIDKENPTITEGDQTFYMDYPQDIVFHYDKKDYDDPTVTGISDSTVSLGTVTLAKDKVSALGAGNHEISFNFGDGKTLTRNVTVKAARTISVTAPTTAFKHGDTFSADGLKITITEDGTAKDYTYSSGTWTPTLPTGVQIKWTKDSTPVDVATWIATAEAKKVRYTAKTGDSTNPVINGDTITAFIGSTGSSQSAGVTVKQKAITIDPAVKTGINKVYDGTAIAADDVAAANFSDQLVLGDSVSINLDGKYYVSDTPSFTADETNDKVVKFTVNKGTDDVGNYNITVNNGRGKITKRKLKITAIDNSSNPATKNNSDTATKSNVSAEIPSTAVTLSSESGYYTTVADRDSKVTFKYKYTYPTITAAGTVNDVTIENIALDTAYKTNYSLEPTTSLTNQKGYVNDRTVDNIEITTQPDLVYNYGVENDYQLNLNDMAVKVTYSDGSEVFTFDAAHSKWTGNNGTNLSLTDMPITWTNTSLGTLTNDMDLEPKTHAGEKIHVAYGGKEDDTTGLTVNKKKLTAKAELASGSLEKVYDGDQDVDKATFTYTILTGKVGDDEVTVNATAKYADNANVADSKAINFTVGDLTGADALNYIKPDSIASLTGKITKRPLKVTSITNIKSVEQYTVQRTGSYTAVNGDATGKATATYEGSEVKDDGVVPGDTVEISFNYEYTEESVQTTGDKNNVNVTGIALATASDSNNNGNYSIPDTDTPTTGSGKVTDVTINSISLNIPNNKYTYIDNDKLNLVGATVTVNKGGTNDTYTAFADGDSIKWQLNDDAFVESVPFTLAWGGFDGTTAAHGDSLKPSERTGDNGKIFVKHTSGTTGNDVTITVNKKTIDKVTATLDNDANVITKVYNNSNALIDTSHIVYTPSYVKGVSDETVEGLTITSTPTYNSVNKGDNIKINFTKPTMTDDNYKLADNLEVTSLLTGKITEREIKVAIIADSAATERTVNDTEKTVDLTKGTNYTETLVSGNPTETKTLMGDDGVTLKVTATYANLNEGEQSIPAAASLVGNDTYKNYKLTFVGGNVKGNVKASEVKLTITAAHADVAVYKGTTTDDANKVGITSGYYSLSELQQYTVVLTTNSDYVFTGWTSDNANFSGKTTETITFTAPSTTTTTTITATANFERLPYWVTALEDTVDKTTGATVKVGGDYNIAKVQINDSDLTAGADNDYTVSDKTIVIKPKALAGLTTNNNFTLKVFFTDVPTGKTDYVEDTAQLINNETATTTLSNIIYTQPEDTKTYGTELNLNGMEFSLTTAQPGESDKVVKYKNDAGTWKKSTDNGASWNNVTLADDNLSLAWSNGANGGTVEQDAVLYNSKHDGETINVTYTPASGAPQTKSTGVFTVTKIALTLGATASGITKEYDGTTTIDATNKAKITPSITTGTPVSTDNIQATVVSAEYEGKYVGSEKVNVALSVTGNNLNEYEYPNAIDQVDGEITAKTINITDVKIPSVKPTETGDNLTKTKTGTLADMNGTFTAEGIVANDDLAFTVTGVYQTPLTQGSTPSFAKVDTTPTAGQYQGTVTGLDSGNYTFNWADTATGEVSTSTLENIIIKTQPSQTKAESPATHGQQLDLSALVVTLDFADKSYNRDVAFSDAAAWTREGLSVSIANETVLRHDTHNGQKITVSKGTVGKETDALRVNQMPLKATVTATGIEKTYDGENTVTGVTPTINIVSGTPLAADNIDAADITATLTYDTARAGDNKTVTPAIDFKAATPNSSNYTLALDGSQSALTGKISKRVIAISKITVDPIFVNATNKVRTGSDVNINTADKISYTGSVVAGDTITVSYQATYNDVSETAAQQASVNVPFTGAEPSYTVTGGAKGSVNNDYDVQFPANATGKVNEKTLSDIEVTPAKTSYTHGENFVLAGTKVKLTYSDAGAEAETYIYGTNGTLTGWFAGTTVPTDGTTAPVSELPNDVTYSWGSGTDTTVTESAVRYDSDHFTGTAPDPKTGNIVFTNSNGVSKSVEITVAKKPLTVDVSGSISKTYNKSKAVDSTTTKSLTFTLNGGVATGDSIVIDQGTTTNTCTFHDLNAGSTTVDFDIANIAYTTDTGIANYSITLGTNNATATISQKTLNVKIADPVVTVGDPVTKTIDITNGNGYTTDDLETGDNVVIAYTYNFGTNGTAVAGTKTLTASSAVIKDTANAPGKNYDLNPTTTPSEGTVNNKEINTVSVTPPTATYEHGSLLSMSGAKVTINYVSGASDVFTYSSAGKWVTAGGAELPTSVRVNWADPTAAGSGNFDNVKLRYDYGTDEGFTNHKRAINVYYKKTDTSSEESIQLANITVTQKTIDKIVVGGDTTVSKTYDGGMTVTGGTITYSVDNSYIATGDTVTVDATIEYPEANANYNSDGSSKLSGKDDYTMTFKDAHITANTNDCYKLADGGVSFVKANLTDAADVKGIIKQRVINVASVPVKATVANGDATTAYTDQMTNVTVGPGDNDIKLDADSSFVGTDEANLRASYYFTYKLSDIQAGTASPTVNVATFSVTGITESNYQINWPSTATGTITTPAKEIKYLTDAVYKKEFNHTEKLDLSGMKFTVVYTTNEEVTFECKADGWYKSTGGGAQVVANPADDGISFVWSDTGTTVSNKSTLRRHDHTNGKETITIKAPGENGVDKTLKTDNITIKPLPIYAKVTAKTGANFDKSYNNSPAADVNGKLTFSYYKEAAGTTDCGNELTTDGVSIADITSGATYRTADGNADDKNVALDGSNAVTTKPIKLPSITLSGTYAADYDLKNADALIGADDIAGKISPIDVTVTVNGVPDATEDRTEKELASSYYTVSPALYTEDGVTITVKYSYAGLTGTTPMVPLTLSTSSSTTTGLNNYNIALASNSVQGKINTVTIDDISVAKDPETKYVHGSTLDISGMEVAVHSTDNTTVTYVYVKTGSKEGWAVKKTEAYTDADVLTTDPFTVSWVDASGNPIAAPTDGKMTHNGYNNTKIKVTTGTSSATMTKPFTVDPVKVYIKVTATGEITKVYNNSEALATSDLDKLSYKLQTEVNGVKQDLTTTDDVRINKTNVSAKYNNENVATFNGTVIEKQIEVSGLAIAGTDVTNGNYVLAGTESDVKGKITPLAVKVSAREIPPVFTSSPAGTSVTVTRKIYEPSLYTGDDVTVPMTAVYTNPAESNAVTFKLGTITGDQKDNYSFSLKDVVGQGTVVAVVISGIEVTKNPDKTTYTEGDKLELKGAEITVKSNDLTSKVYAYNETDKKWYNKQDNTDEITPELNWSANGITKGEAVTDGEEITKDKTTIIVSLRDKVSPNNIVLTISGKPTPAPTATPIPTAAPTADPTAKPTAEPTAAPTAEPTAAPTAEPTAAPTAEPTAAPTAEPTAAPTAEPTAAPTVEPTVAPTVEPTATPTAAPTATPTPAPTAAPSTGGGGGGGGVTNSLTIKYELEGGKAGDSVSKLSAPAGSDSVDLIAVYKTAPKDPTVIWTSSNEKVAKVDENGVVSFISEGTATITATSKTNKSLTDKVEVTVTKSLATPTPVPGTPEPAKPEPTKAPSVITKTMLNPYIVGYDNNVFGPELPISREEVTAIFARLIANSIYMDKEYTPSFPDVEPNGWSKDYIGYLEGFKIVNGYDDGTFKPKAYITRAEMAVMMAKAEGYDISGYLEGEKTGFPDIAEGYNSWATKAIKYLTEAGVMLGYEDGTFRPDRPITRAETVATVNRVLADMVVDKIEVLPSDVTEAHWAYNDIVFAMNHRILKDAAADPFVWSEELDKNLETIKVDSDKDEKDKTGGDTPSPSPSPAPDAQPTAAPAATTEPKK